MSNTNVCENHVPLIFVVSIGILIIIYSRFTQYGVFICVPTNVKFLRLNILAWKSVTCIGSQRLDKSHMQHYAAIYLNDNSVCENSFNSQ